MVLLNCFKAYDIRGVLGTELNDDIAYRIGGAFALFYRPQRVVLGSDIRLTSSALKLAVARGLMDQGTDVIDIGMTGSEEVYFATRSLQADGGIEITASHNPDNYNGMKIVGREARPVSSDSGLKDIQALAENHLFSTVAQPGSYQQRSNRSAYLDHLLSYLTLPFGRPLRVVVNAGNGAAGPTLDALENAFRARSIPLNLIKIHHEPDGTFPHGIPNPMLPENRLATRDAVLAHRADLGIAWDGDFDRCFIFDERGDYVEAYYIVGLLAALFLQRSPGEKILHDPRLVWNTRDIINASHGIAIETKTGHAFIKERMRSENAIYGGEMSAHHYFRDFGYCDSGMIPALLVLQHLSQSRQKMSGLVAARKALFPVSGEMNISVSQPAEAIRRVRDHYQHQALSTRLTDGLSMEFDNWRFNLRCSNTEPLLRLNVETRQSNALLAEITGKLLALAGA
ncbi:phosphomannomutase CpsG [Rahnella sp. C60]|uniref:phosphomannomutase CpsG n=1 Tax=Rahnella perminowiae TaxID=2816244 RepID=UPI001C27466D|nr:phosphomannomutase CpsG [Rahnella perminowiae]MBU9810627.1 phosphomannomutase CpsG [Rahnella perminowiae]MBU9814116.1 phosphomannomutase CpsG [Rahnella perminowiae]